MQAKTIKNVHFPLTLILAIFLVMSTVAQSQSISADLQRLPKSSAVDVIVQYRHKPTDADHSLAKRMGATEPKNLGLIKATKYRMTPAAATKLVLLCHPGDPTGNFA